MDPELSVEDKEFLAKCEEEFKDRFTEKDEEYMKVFNRSPSTPPIMENWQASNYSGRRNDRRHDRRRFHPHDRRDNRQGGSNRERYNNHNDYSYNRSRY